MGRYGKRLTLVGLAVLFVAALWVWPPTAVESWLGLGVKASAPASATGVRKCRRGASVTYTNGECPPGSREEAVDAGTVTVLPAERPGAPAASASATPLLRQWAGSVDPSEIRDKHLERTVGK